MLDWNVDNAWLCASILFMFVPLAVIAGFVDTWNTEGGRLFRAQLAHPFRSFRANHPRLDLRLAHRRP